MSEKKAAVLLAEGFEEGETLFIIDIFRRAKITCDSVSIENEMVKGGHDIYVKADRIIDEAMFDEYDMVVIPGGLAAAERLSACEPVRKWVRRFVEEDKYAAAICAGVMVLKAAGVSAGRTITSYPGEKYYQMFAGSDYIDDNAKLDQMVAVDGKLITSRGPATTFPFAFRIAEALGADTEPLKKGMLYHAFCDSIRNS